jgi:acyl-coenzyme A synthetase/AMP-(fatty) acid ligase
MPSEIEAVLRDHVAVQSAGVVGVPHEECTSLARAYVVLKPGHDHVTADELIQHVAARLPEYKHLHGGLVFLHELPVNRGGKLDRSKLKLIAKCSLNGQE